MLRVRNRVPKRHTLGLKERGKFVRSMSRKRAADIGKSWKKFSNRRKQGTNRSGTRSGTCRRQKNKKEREREREKRRLRGGWKIRTSGIAQSARPQPVPIGTQWTFMKFRQPQIYRSSPLFRPTFSLPRSPLFPSFSPRSVPLSLCPRGAIRTVSRQ